LWQQDVEDDHIEGAGLGERQAGQAIVGNRYGVSLLFQAAFQRCHELHFIFDDQDVHRAPADPPAASPWPVTLILPRLS